MRKISARKNSFNSPVKFFLAFILLLTCTPAWAGMKADYRVLLLIVVVGFLGFAVFTVNLIMCIVIKKWTRKLLIACLIMFIVQIPFSIFALIDFPGFYLLFPLLHITQAVLLYRGFNSYRESLYYNGFHEIENEK